MALSSADERIVDLSTIHTRDEARNFFIDRACDEMRRPFVPAPKPKLA